MSETFEYKQIIALRNDIEMSKGKLVVQGAHAAVAAVMITRNKKPFFVHRWFKEGQKKVVIRINTLEELLEIKKKAEEMDIPCALIQDRGLTELEPGTITALGIGPAPERVIDKITGDLPLF